MNLPVPTAKDINEAHRLARASAETAVEHAIRCGQLLATKKAAMARGEFDGWVEQHCEFGRATAYNYMKASKSSNALDGSAIRHLFPSGKPGAKPGKPQSNTQSERREVMNPPESANRGSEAGNLSMRHGEDAGQVRPPDPASDAPERWVPDEDEEAYLEKAEKEYAESIDKVMAADDKLAAAHEEIKRQAAEIASLKMSRDGYLNGKNAVVKLLKAEQSKVKKLGRALDKAKAEIETLRERIAIMEEAAA